MGQKKTETLYSIPEYRAWRHMRQRCSPTFKHSKWYFERGISVCERWDSYANFLSDMGNKPSPKHSLDRINNDRGYSPKNCRWATSKQQSENKSTTIYLVFKGTRLRIDEWADRIGMKRATLRNRYHRRWSTRRALTEKVWYS